MIHCPETQNINHLEFRHFQGEDDYALMVELFNACKEFDGQNKMVSIQYMQNDEHWRKNYDIHQQLIFVEFDHTPIGYFQFNWAQEQSGDVLHYIDLVLKEDFYDDTIPQAILDYQERKLTELTDNLKFEGKRYFHIWRKMQGKRQVEFYQSNEYKPARYFFEMLRPMSHPLDQSPLPENFEIRSVRPEHYRMIWDAENEAFRDHWGYAEPTEEQFQGWIKDRHFQPQLWKVAWEGNQICGMVGNYLDESENQAYARKRGYTQNISVRRPWRKRGLARALLAESIRMFQDMGMTETALGVDVENLSGALSLYTKMGYLEEKDKTSVVLRKALA